MKSKIAVLSLLCIVFLAALCVSSLAYYTPFYRDQTNVHYTYPGYYGNEWNSGYGYASASYGYYRQYSSYSYNYYPYYYGSPRYYSYATYNYYPTYYSSAYPPTPIQYYTYDSSTNGYSSTGVLYYNPAYNNGRTFYLVG